MVVHGTCWHIITSAQLLDTAWMDALHLWASTHRGGLELLSSEQGGAGHKSYAPQSPQKAWDPQCPLWACLPWAAICHICQWLFVCGHCSRDGAYPWMPYDKDSIFESFWGERYTQKTKSRMNREFIAAWNITVSTEVGLYFGFQITLAEWSQHWRQGSNPKVHCIMITHTTNCFYPHIDMLCCVFNDLSHSFPQPQPRGIW